MRATKLLTTILLGLLLTGPVFAAELKAYQLAALEKILATLPAEQREMARPSLEMSLVHMNEAHVALLLSQYDSNTARGGATEQTDEKPAADDAGEWGPAEADFEQAFSKAQSFIARISDRHDAMQSGWKAIPTRLEDEWHSKGEYGGFAESTAIDTCERAMNGVPVRRREHAGMRELLDEQDRSTLRVLIELRAQYESPEAYAQAIGIQVDSEQMQGLRYHFAKPLTESAVMDIFRQTDERITQLVRQSSLERRRIDTTAYADAQSVVGSPTRDRDLEALQKRTDAAATTVCDNAYGAYIRGLAGIVQPVVPKVKARE